MKLTAVAFAVLSAGASTACSAPEPASESARSGTADQAWCGGLYVTQVATRAGTVFFVSPETLATSTDGWGPQALSLSVSQGFSPQVSYQTSPSISWQTDDITRSLSNAVGFSVEHSVNLIAATTVLVPTEAYYRLEAYPEYEVIDWSLRADACGWRPGFFVATGTVYRPVGVHFRALRLVGSEWNALSPPSPAELSSPPPWAHGGRGAAAPSAAAGGPAVGAAGSAAGPTSPGGAEGPSAAGGAAGPTAPGGAAGPTAPGGAAASIGAGD